MSPDVHILVVDDEPDIRESVKEYLELKGFRVTCAESSEAARSALAGSEFHLALLDITMPGEDGLSLARYLREHTSVAVIMLTSADSAIDRVIGLEVGADDYVTKPADLRELLARINAVLGRLSGAGAKAASPTSHEAANSVSLGGCNLDLDAHKLFDCNGEEVSITSMEFDLLKVFAENPGRVLSRDQLSRMAHDRDWDPSDRSIDIRIGRLRRKIERDPAKPSIIKTVHGEGYVFAAK